MSESDRMFKKSAEIFPSGVNSPVRYFSPHPVFIRRASGPHMFDEDGNTYIDYCLGFGPHILGHSHPVVAEALKEQADRAISPGTANRYEQELGQMILEATGEEMMRFTNSGTEATMHAIRLARGYTGRKFIVKMEGCYHGAHDYSLIKTGSGGITFGSPSSRGIPPEVAGTVIPVTFNDLNSVEDAFRNFGKNIAAVITEPVMGNAGVILPEDGFLEGLRDICDRYSALLILDEVITGFRFHYGNYQQLTGIRADITTYGKIIGGGLPVGALASSKSIMRYLAPSGSVYEAGTFSGNPMTMAAGTAALNVLKHSNYSMLDTMSEEILGGIIRVLRNNGLNATGNRIGGMFQFFFNTDAVKNYNSAIKSNSEMYMKFFSYSLENGIYFAPGQFETNFLSFSHTAREIDDTLKRVEISAEKIA